MQVTGVHSTLHELAHTWVGHVTSSSLAGTTHSQQGTVMHTHSQLLHHSPLALCSLHWAYLRCTAARHNLSCSCLHAATR